MENEKGKRGVEGKKRREREGGIFFGGVTTFGGSFPSSMSSSSPDLMFSL